jgi:alkanesulfonate monooxygenase SsuD/methylene tetrahydromethanopterin reductase-like flavin-dependent oxidoreductase (luciferase family)
MKFSLLFSFMTLPGSKISHLDTFREMDRLVPLAEELGYHAIHVSEHHFQKNGWSPIPMMALAKAAGLTKGMRLATSISVSTLCQPLRLLESIAMIDNLSEGRFTYGTAPGYALEEFEAYGVPYKERFKLHEEIIDFLQHAWRNPGNIGFEGSYIKVPDAELVPRPVQKELPIWYGVSGPKLLERAARRGVPVIASLRHSVDELRQQFDRFEAAAKECGYTPSERPIQREVFVAESAAEAQSIAAPGVADLFGLYVRKSIEGQRELRDDLGKLVQSESDFEFERFAGRYLIGDPATVIGSIRELQDAVTPTELVLRMQLPGISTEAQERSMRLFANDVMPAFT